MNCEKAFDNYLLLDKNERVPLLITLHLLRCPSCRTGVRLMTRSEKILATPITAEQPVCTDDPIIAEALARIAASGLNYTIIEKPEHQVSLFRWMISGIALVAGFAVVPTSTIGIWSSQYFGATFMIPFYLICGLTITAYCGMFIGTNIDFFVKKFGIPHST